MAKSKGFSLLEITIVLGVMAVLISGIWAVTSSSRESARALQAYEEFFQLVQNIRDYNARVVFPTSAIAAATYTATLRDAAIFPEVMCNANCIAAAGLPKNLYGGLVTAEILIAQSQLQIVYKSVPRKACVEIGRRLSVQANDFALLGFKVGTGSFITTFPISPSTLVSNCTSATSNDLTVKLRLRI